MSQKNVAAVLILIATALGTPPLAKHAVTGAPEPTIEVSGPEEADVGQLIKLEYPAKKVEWILPTNDSVNVSNGTVVLSFREAGDYEVVVSGNVGDSVQIAKHEIAVGAQEPETPEPETPEPETPEPESLESLVYDWCESENAPKRACEDLASNFIDAGGQSSTVRELVENTARLNRSVDQTGVKGVLGKIQAYLSKELAGKNYIEHQQVWGEISTGLLRWSRSR